MIRTVLPQLLKIPFVESYLLGGTVNSYNNYFLPAADCREAAYASKLLRLDSDDPNINALNSLRSAI